MKKYLMACFLCISAQSIAGQMDAVPTCYNNKLPASSGPVETELFVVIDQTTPFDGVLRQSVADNVRRFIQPNYAFSVTQFSAFTQGHYADVLVSGRLDKNIDKSARDDISKPVLTKFDQCISMQSKITTQLIGRAMKTAFGESGSDIAKSDVLSSLKDISGKVRQSKADKKVVLIASDMLENSSITSFYSKQAVRQINPEKELDLAINNQMIADFGGANIYVIGAGLLAENAQKPKGVYRSPQIMQSLSTFWKTWFKKSNAELIEFGQPALLNPVQ